MHITEKGVIAWMARNPVAANLFLILVMAAGYVSIDGIKKEVFPTFPASTNSVADRFR